MDPSYTITVESYEPTPSIEDFDGLVGVGLFQRGAKFGMNTTWMDRRFDQLVFFDNERDRDAIAMRFLDAWKLYGGLFELRMATTRVTFKLSALHGIRPDEEENPRHRFVIRVVFGLGERDYTLVCDDETERNSVLVLLRSALKDHLVDASETQTNSCIKNEL